MFEDKESVFNLPGIIILVFRRMSETPFNLDAD